MRRSSPDLDKAIKNCSNVSDYGLSNETQYSMKILFNKHPSSHFPCISMVIILLTVFSALIGQVSPQKQVFKVAIDSEYAPYEFVDETGEVTGFTVSLLKKIGNRAGIEFEFIPMTWPEAVAALESGDADLVNMIRSPERSTKFLFSDPHASVAQAIFQVSAYCDSSGLETLKGHVVAFQKDDISLEILEGRSDFERVIVTSKEEGFLKLSTGQVDFFFAAEQPSIWLLDKYNLENIHLSSWGLFPQKYCFAVRSNNAELLATLNTQLQGLRNSGEYNILVRQWLKLDPGEQGLKDYVREILWISLILAALAIALILGNLLLRKRVERRTRDLEDAKQIVHMQAESLLNLIAHIPDGILHESSDRIIQQTNQQLLNLFGLAQPVEDLIGAECRQIFRQLKPLFHDGDRFVQRIEEILAKKQPVSKEEIALADGRTFERDYVPIQVTPQLTEHLWHYRDISQRKQAEVQLEQSSQNFQSRTLLKRAILESPQRIIIFALDKNYCYLDFTKQHQQTMKAIWGVDIEIGKDMLLCIKDVGDREKAKKNFDRAMQGDRFIINEAYGDENLSRNYYENWYSPLTDADDEIIGVSVYVIDISDRMQAESQREEALAALRISEERYRLIVENAHDGIEIAQDDRIIFTNTQFARMMGYPLHEIKNTDFSQFFTPEGLADLYERNRLRAAGTQLPHNYETTMKRKDGSTFIAEVNYEIIEYNNKPATFAIIRDISERKQIEDTKRKKLVRRERIANVISNIAISPNLVSGAIRELAVELNEAAAKALGVERVGVWLLDDTATELVCVDTYNANLNEHFHGGILYENEFQNEFTALKNSKYVDANDPYTDPRTAGYVEGYLKPNSITSMLDAVFRNEGRMLGTLCFEHVNKPHTWEDDEIAFACQLADQVALALANRDQKAADLALKQSHKSLEKALLDLKNTQEQLVQQERLGAVGQLAAGVAHDFNNILTSISGYSELLLMSSEISEEMKNNLEKISIASHRAANLVRQLLDFSRKTIRKPKQFDLALAVQESVNFFGRTIPENIQIKLTIEPGEFTIEADQTQIQQVITNLVINARDAMPAGGKLDLTLARNVTNESQKCAACGRSIIGEWITLAVSDTGAGIPSKVLPRIFEPFFTTKPVGEGTGLGLSQVLGIINQHEGHITVESDSGKGSSFKVYLPHTANLTSGYEPLTLPDIKRGHGETILLVEDEAIVLDACKSVLEHLGYNIVSTNNGREALAIYQKMSNEIALIITDMVMPDIDGGELFKALKSEAPSIKVVLMSGYPIDEKGQLLLEQGAIAWLEKPISFKQLSNVVCDALTVDFGRWGNRH